MINEQDWVVEEALQKKECLSEVSTQAEFVSFCNEVGLNVDDDKDEQQKKAEPITTDNNQSPGHKRNFSNYSNEHPDGNLNNSFPNKMQVDNLLNSNQPNQFQYPPQNNNIQRQQQSHITQNVNSTGYPSQQNPYQHPVKNNSLPTSQPRQPQNRITQNIDSTGHQNQRNHSQYPFQNNNIPRTQQGYQSINSNQQPPPPPGPSSNFEILFNLINQKIHQPSGILDTKLTQLLNEINSIKKKSNEEKIEINLLKEKINTQDILINKIKNTDNSNNHFETILKQLSQKIIFMENNNNEKNKEINELKEKTNSQERLINEIKKSNASNNIFETMLKEISEKIALMENNNNEKYKEINGLKEKANSQDRLIDEIKTNNSNNNLTAMLNQLSDKVEIMESQNNENEDEISLLNETGDNLSMRVEFCEQKDKDQDEIIIALENRIAEQDKIIFDHTSNLGFYKNELDSKNKELNDKNKIINDVLQINNEVEKIINDIETIKQNKIEIVKRLDDCMYKKDRVFFENNIKEDYKLLSNCRVEISEIKNNLHDQLEKFNSKLEKFNRQIINDDDLRVMNELLQSTINNKLQELQNVIERQSRLIKQVDRLERKNSNSNNPSVYRDDRKYNPTNRNNEKKFSESYKRHRGTLFDKGNSSPIEGNEVSSQEVNSNISFNPFINNPILMNALTDASLNFPPPLFTPESERIANNK